MPHTKSTICVIPWHVSSRSGAMLVAQNATHFFLPFITLYAELDAKCDQQVTVVGRLLTALGHVH